MERKRAREEQAAVVNKMFYQENSTVGNQQAVQYNVIAQVKKVCEVVDGFIYVANAEAHKSKQFLSFSLFFFFKFIFCEWYFVDGWNVIKICEKNEIRGNPCSDCFTIYFFSAVSSGLTQRSPILNTLHYFPVRGYVPLIWL